MSNEFLYYFLIFFYSSVLIFLFIKYFRWKVLLQKNFYKSEDLSKYKIILVIKFAVLFFVGLYFFHLYITSDEINIAFDENAEVIIAVDVSGSMLANFTNITRLQAAKDLSQQIVLNLRCKTSVIAFAGNAYVLVPFTDDIELFSTTIEGLHPNDFTFQGSNLEKVFEKAIDNFSKSKHYKLIFILSDGEIFDGDSEKYIDELKKQVIKCCFVSIGSPNEEIVKQGSYKHYDKDFKTRANHQFFQKIALKSKSLHYKVDEFSDIAEFKDKILTKIINKQEISFEYNRLLLIIILILLIIIVKL